MNLCALPNIKQLTSRRFILLSLSFLLLGCLRFEDQEWVSPNVTKAHLTEITKFTGLALPDGSVGLAYLVGGARDGYMKAKIQVPADKIGDVLSQKIFRDGKNQDPSMSDHRLPPWWKPGTLMDRQNRAIDGNRFGGCIFGKEGNDYILYIIWFDT